jgi:hypothetical protein
MLTSSISKETPRRPAYFWWILAHALVICFCALSWFITLHVFKYPENAQNYRILKKIGRNPVPFSFTAFDAPAGETLRPETIYRKYAPFADKSMASKLQKTNKFFLRSYLQNYLESNKPIYVEGNYSILEIRPLTLQDLFYPGFAIRAQALVQPDKLKPAAPYPVYIEYLYPSDSKIAFTWFKPGDLLTIQKIPNCASIINVAHLGTVSEPIINLTLVPIAYNDYKIGKIKVLTIRAPTDFNLDAKLPVFHGEMTDDKGK